MRSSDVTADILNFLCDGKTHTLQEIADEVECSRRTVQRHITSLKYRYPIENAFGRGDKQGVYLDKKYLYQGKIRSRDELQIISQALELLQKSGSDVDQTLLASLIQEYQLPNQAGEIAQ